MTDAPSAGERLRARLAGMLPSLRLRLVVVFALVAAQVIGSVATIAARATSPDRLGPGGVFPNFALNAGASVRSGNFWGCLVCQLAVCIGFGLFFRKEQLTKP